MNKLFTVLFLSIITACVQREKPQNEIEMNLEFDKYTNTFIEQFWNYYPDWATNVGYHQNDSVLLVPTETTRGLQEQFAKEQLSILHNYQLTTLTDAQKIDYHLIENQLNRILWQLNEEKSFQWEPSQYNVSGLIAFMLSENYAPLEKRLRYIQARMQNIPSYYKAALENLLNPVEVLRILAIKQNTGGIAVFEEDLKDSILASGLSELEKNEMLQSVKLSVESIRGYIDFLTKLSNPTPRDFRLGKELYDKKFGFDIQSIYTAEQVYDSAQLRKEFLHNEMYKITQKLWTKYFGNQPIPENYLLAIRRMIDTLSLNHVTPSTYQQTIASQLPDLVDFIKKKNLLFIDETKPLVVRKEPAYMAGVSIASISAPGPYDKTGNTYYNVGNIENWTAERAESHLREYNHYILQILNIHEAIPGHYTQLVYANQNPSLVKSIFSNGTMIEGWAVYTEQMMLENGYGNNELEMWLMWYKWHLRTVCNTILDYSVHVKGMTEQDAMHLLMNEAFQQEAEAHGKWVRVCVTSVQLMSYYTGYKEICELRETLKRKNDQHFDLKSFHENFLSYGNAPVKYIREMMLK